MVNAPLACSVRNCGRPLQRGERAWSCALDHSFDIAKSGYVNLLQPQDRRSPQAGDLPAAIAARARALAGGVGRSIMTRFAERAAALPLAEGAVVVDLGCGSGDALAELARLRNISAVGVDLSATAVDAAARAHPALTWVVANADRRLPLLDQRVALVLSFHGRRNAAECARVLQPDGHLLMAAPAPDDLAQLREVVQGSVNLRDRGERLVDAHRQAFTIVEQSTLREVVHASRDQLVDLLHGTYRGVRAAGIRRAESLSAMDVTLASDVLLFRRN